MEDKYYKYDQLTIHKEGLIMKIAKIIAISMFVGMLLLVFGCKKSSDDGVSPGYGSVDIQLTDNAPRSFLAANVDIRSVQLHYAGSDTEGETGWVDIPTNTGIYNVLDLQNDVFAIIARGGQVNPGKVTQMRVMLGDRNTVVVLQKQEESALMDTVTYPMDLSSQYNTGLKFNLNTHVIGGKRMVLTLDFDAKQSIIEQGTGEYQLTPVLKIKSIAYR